ncbi:hypothetical protein HGM15179_013450 [Zosterops borbonicus]|uniref:Uncharacterized protein n=1 Tax=Zosterops borbonicus TaxID=364589 RepID=A0A8K1G8K9_9PASS|nr:hypothetical protein HGM15179_013450 [Zosterops borbonicus]
MERWEEKKLKFNRGQCKVLHLCRNNPRHQHRLGDELLKISSAEKDLGVLVANKLSMNQQCVLGAKKASEILGALGRALPAGYTIAYSTEVQGRFNAETMQRSKPYLVFLQSLETPNSIISTAVESITIAVDAVIIVFVIIIIIIIIIIRFLISLGAGVSQGLDNKGFQVHSDWEAIFL